MVKLHYKTKLSTQKAKPDGIAQALLKTLSSCKYCFLQHGFLITSKI